jgi:transposase-like protein
MDQQAVIADIERRARDAHLSIRRICMHAGVHPTTFSRWKRTLGNPEPIGANMRLIEKLYDALRDLSPAKPSALSRQVAL